VMLISYFIANLTTETVQFYGNHVMLILNPVQEIQHNHHVMPDLIRHPHGTGIDPESSSG